MMNIVIEELQKLNIPFEESVDLKRKTWIHRGGIAKIFITPRNAEELEQITKVLYQKKVDFFLFGHTSNLYIKNTRDLDVVVSTIKCGSIEVSENVIICEAGTSVIKLSNQMIEKGITGFEYLTELPGTVGAALVNNSSCKDNSISKLLVSANVLLSDGCVKTLYPEDFHFTFRNSVFKSGKKIGTILTVTLARINGDSESLKRIAVENSLERERRLGGHAKNLGCTVNKVGNPDKMELRYYLPMQVIRAWGKITRRSYIQTNKCIYHTLCKLAHCQQVERYISPHNPIVFVWEDDDADEAFPAYLDFMDRVYKFNSLEIKVVE